MSNRFISFIPLKRNLHQTTGRLFRKCKKISDGYKFSRADCNVVLGFDPETYKKLFQNYDFVYTKLTKDLVWEDLVSRAKTIYVHADVPYSTGVDALKDDFVQFILSLKNSVSINFSKEDYLEVNLQGIEHA